MRNVKQTRKTLEKSQTDSDKCISQTDSDVRKQLGSKAKSKTLSKTRIKNRQTSYEAETLFRSHILSVASPPIDGLMTLEGWAAAKNPLLQDDAKTIRGSHDRHTPEKKQSQIARKRIHYGERARGKIKFWNTIRTDENRPFISPYFPQEYWATLKANIERHWKQIELKKLQIDFHERHLKTEIDFHEELTFDDENDDETQDERLKPVLNEHSWLSDEIDKDDQTNEPQCFMRTKDKED